MRLLWPKCKIWHLAMLNFIELALSHLSSVSRYHCRAFLPAADQHSCPTWNSNTYLSLWAAEGQSSPGTVPMQLKHGSLCTHLHNYNSDTFKLYFEFSQEQKFVFLAKVPASKWQGAYIPSTSCFPICLGTLQYGSLPCSSVLLGARICLSSPWLLQDFFHLQGKYLLNLKWMMCI